MKKTPADHRSEDISGTTTTEKESFVGDSNRNNKSCRCDANANLGKKSINIPISYNEYNLHEAIATDETGVLKDLVRQFLQLSDLLHCLLLSILWNLA